MRMAKKPILKHYKAADKDLAYLRDQYESEIDVLNRAWDEFQGLFSRQIIEDERLWTELADRWEIILKEAWEQTS